MEELNGISYFSSALILFGIVLPYISERCVNIAFYKGPYYAPTLFITTLAHIDFVAWLAWRMYRDRHR